MTSCEICKKSFSDRDKYVGGKLIAKFDEFYPNGFADNTQDMCEGCLFQVINFMGQLKNRKKKKDDS